MANEGGGMLVLGMADNHPHKVVGSDFGKDKLGELADAVYSHLAIRIRFEELFENDLRILVVNIPSRPIGKTLKFEGVPLMRIGDSLRNMSDEELFSILSEQEPDFSAKICEGLTLADLDENAMLKMKEAYSKKQDNPQFMSLSNSQALSDLGLTKANQLTYAALILVGKVEAINKYLPQSAIHFEYRNTLSQIVFDSRTIFAGPYYLIIDDLWEAINQRNGKIPVQEGLYIFDIPFFNKEVIREAINNTVAHRDYRKTSEVLIKQFPYHLYIINPGGFPLGVTLDNLLTVSSTPRNRLLADVLAKTGIVERSGQGVDKVYYQTISEGKPEPDYSYSDNFQVELRLSAVVEEKAFSLFIRHIQENRKDDEKLGVQEVIALNRIRKDTYKNSVDETVIKKLIKEGLVERVGKTNSQKLILGKEYFVFTDKKGEYSAIKPIDNKQAKSLIVLHLQEFGKAKMADFEAVLNRFMNKNQIRYLIEQLVEQGVLDKEGQFKGTIYTLAKKVE
ncbi:MAG: ATP-binding protein [Paludibacter sp.]|nr:ATP-binding protein [Paludibacter sp.]